MGSSPRMRGALHFIGSEIPSDRIIPAYAGSTTGRSPTRSASRDHPRVCGEHHSRVNCELRIEGSSPRMRGAHKANFIADRTVGIIPAYAGSTLELQRLGLLHRDHPRVCGEHFIQPLRLLMVNAVRTTGYMKTSAAGSQSEKLCTLASGYRPSAYISMSPIVDIDLGYELVVSIEKTGEVTATVN